MPWRCDDCGGEVSLDTSSCPGCGAVKAEWTMVADQTRTFTLARAKFLLKRRDEARGVIDTEQAPVFPAAQARAWEAPPPASLVLVRLFPGKKTDLGVTLEVEYVERQVEELELEGPDPPAGEATFTDLPLLFVYALGDDAPPEFAGVRVVDLSEDEGYAPLVEVSALGRPAQALRTRDPNRPLVYSRLLDRCGRAPLAEVAWTLELGSAGERSGRSDREGVIRLDEEDLPLGHFWLRVEAEGALPTTLSTLLDAELPHDVLVRGVDPQDADAGAA